MLLHLSEKKTSSKKAVILVQKNKIINAKNGIIYTDKNEKLEPGEQNKYKQEDADHIPNISKYIDFKKTAGLNFGGNFNIFTPQGNEDVYPIFFQRLSSQ